MKNYSLLMMLDGPIHPEHRDTILGYIPGGESLSTEWFPDEDAWITYPSLRATSVRYVFDIFGWTVVQKIEALGYTVVEFTVTQEDED